MLLAVPFHTHPNTGYTLARNYLEQSRIHFHTDYILLTNQELQPQIYLCLD